jgi:hypothetical protein
MKSYDYRTSMTFLRNNLFIDQSGFPFVYKQIIDLKDFDLIAYTQTHAIELFSKNKQKTVHFFLDDHRFDEVYDKPEKTLKRLSNYKQLLGPDFSMYQEMPTEIQRYNLFKSRWCCSYWQYNKLAVIPTMNWSEEDTFERCFKGVEKGTIVAISTVGTSYVEQGFMLGFKEMIKQVDPEKVINYGSLYEGMEGLVEIVNIPYKFIKSDYRQEEDDGDDDE